MVKFGDIVPADIKILGDEADEDETPMQVQRGVMCAHLQQRGSGGH